MFFSIHQIYLWCIEILDFHRKRSWQRKLRKWYQLCLWTIKVTIFLIKIGMIVISQSQWRSQRMRSVQWVISDTGLVKSRGHNCRGQCAYREKYCPKVRDSNMLRTDCWFCIELAKLSAGRWVLEIWGELCQFNLTNMATKTSCILFQKSNMSRLSQALFLAGKATRICRPNYLGIRHRFRQLYTSCGTDLAGISLWLHSAARWTS